MERRRHRRGNGYALSRDLAPRLVPLAACKSLGRDTRKHPPQQVRKLAASLSRFGFVLPNLIDADRRVVAGWGLVLAARQLGLSEVPAGSLTAYNYAFSLGYDDSHLGYWLTFNPFINVFYNAAGFTNIPTGTHTYRVEIGVKPSFSLQKGWDIPLTVAFPTWVTVAPDSYYNRNDGTTDLCGTTGTMPGSSLRRC